MNKKVLIDKQALINKLTKYVEQYEGATDEYYQGKRSAYEIALKSAKKLGLDEPQKPVVPKFVADWYEHYKHKTLEAKFMHIENAADDRVVNWYEKCKGRHNNPRGNSQETLAMMDLFGYTVEQPKRWVVKNDRGYVAMENFEDFNTCRVGVRMSIVDKKSEGSAWDDVDRKKAEAVATLVDGSVEEV